MVRLNLPPGVVLPDIFNLGVAPPPPKYATRFAQRVRFALPDAMGTLPPRNWASSGGLVLNSFYLPPTALGTVTLPPLQAGLLPNPYNPAQW
jgi:hypothetical protein